MPHKFGIYVSGETIYLLKLQENLIILHAKHDKYGENIDKINFIKSYKNQLDRIISLKN